MRLRLSATLRRLAALAALLSVCLTMIQPALASDAVADVHHRYSPTELAEMSRVQLAELVLALQRSPDVPLVDRDADTATRTPVIATPAAARHKVSPFVVAGAAVGGMLLVSSLRSHGGFGSGSAYSPGTSLASVRRAQAASTCNPDVQLGCGVSVTSATCTTVQNVSSVLTPLVTAWAAQTASKNTQPAGYVGTAKANLTTTPADGTPTTTSVNVAQYATSVAADASKPPKLPLEQSGGVTTPMIVGAAVNFAATTAPVWIGCKNQVTNNGSNTNSTATSLIRH